MLHELEKPALKKRTLRRSFHGSCSDVVVVLLWICMVHLEMALVFSRLTHEEEDRESAGKAAHDGGTDCGEQFSVGMKGAEFCIGISPGWLRNLSISAESLIPGKPAPRTCAGRNCCSPICIPTPIARPI